MGLLSAGHGGRQRGCYFTIVWASVVASSADWPFCGAETPPSRAEGWMQLFRHRVGRVGTSFLPVSCLHMLHGQLWGLSWFPPAVPHWGSLKMLEGCQA